MVTGRKVRDIEPDFQANGGLTRKPRDLRPDLPPAAEAAILRAIAFRPRDRFPTARAFAEAFAESSAPSQSRRKIVRRAALVASVLVLIAVAGRLRTSFAPPPEPVPERPPSYRLLFAREGGNPLGEPSDGLTVTSRDRIRFELACPRAGFLYLVNESPGGPEFHLLFPDPGRSSEVAAGSLLRVPEEPQHWIRFDNRKGEETFWLVWSPARVPELEAVVPPATEGDRGEITGPARIAALRAVFRDGPSRDIVVQPIRLEHR